MSVGPAALSLDARQRQGIRLGKPGGKATHSVAVTPTMRLV